MLYGQSVDQFVNSTPSISGSAFSPRKLRLSTLTNNEERLVITAASHITKVVTEPRTPLHCIKSSHSFQLTLVLHQFPAAAFQHSSQVFYFPPNLHNSRQHTPLLTHGRSLLLRCLCSLPHFTMLLTAVDSSAFWFLVIQHKTLDLPDVSHHGLFELLHFFGSI